MVEKVREIDSINSHESMSEFIDEFRVYASNNRNNHVLDTIDKAIRKCKVLNDKISLVKLYELKITQIENLREKQEDIVQLAQQMKKISEEINYVDGLALAYNIDWYIEKLRGERKRSLRALEISINYATKYLNTDDYEYNVCHYSLAVEKWFDDHDPSSVDIFEKCADYFWKNGFHRSFIQTISLLIAIYTRLQNGQKILESCKKIFGNRSYFEKLPLDLRALSYYYVGLGYMIDLNLKLAERYFKEAFNIFKKV